MFVLSCRRGLLTGPGDDRSDRESSSPRPLASAREEATDERILPDEPSQERVCRTLGDGKCYDLNEWHSGSWRKSSASLAPPAPGRPSALLDTRVTCCSG